MKLQIPLAGISGISTSPLSDGIMVFHLPWHRKGDLVVRNDTYAVEFMSAVYIGVKGVGKLPKVDVLPT